jgi:hypothetical protein
MAVNDVRQALNEIADIRARVAASSRFRGLAPEVMALGSVLSFAVAVGQGLWPRLLASSPAHYLAVWGAALFGCSILAASEAIVRARALHGGLARAMLLATMRQLVPFQVAGAVIAVVICRSGRDAAWSVPGLWQVLVGLGGLAAAGSLPRGIHYAAGWYLLSGAVVLALAANSQTLSPWLMGGPFGVGQAIVAVILSRASGESHDR